MYHRQSLSTTDDERLECFGKLRYQSYAYAQRVSQKQKYRKDACRPYRCPDCGDWHIGRVVLRKKSSYAR